MCGFVYRGFVLSLIVSRITVIWFWLSVELVDSMVLANVMFFEFVGSSMVLGFIPCSLQRFIPDSCCCDGSRRDSLSKYAS